MNSISITEKKKTLNIEFWIVYTHAVKILHHFNRNAMYISNAINFSEAPCTFQMISIFSEAPCTFQMLSIFLKHPVHFKWYHFFWSTLYISNDINFSETLYSVEFRIYQQHLLLRWLLPPTKNKVVLGMTVNCIYGWDSCSGSGTCEVASLLLSHSDPLWTRMLVPVRIPSMS